MPVSSGFSSKLIIMKNMYTLPYNTQGKCLTILVQYLYKYRMKRKSVSFKQIYSCITTSEFYFFTFYSYHHFEWFKGIIWNSLQFTNMFFLYFLYLLHSVFGVNGMFFILFFLFCYDQGCLH